MEESEFLHKISDEDEQDRDYTCRLDIEPIATSTTSPITTSTALPSSQTTSITPDVNCSKAIFQSSLSSFETDFEDIPVTPPDCQLSSNHDSNSKTFDVRQSDSERVRGALCRVFSQNYSESDSISVNSSLVTSSSSSSSRVSPKRMAKSDSFCDCYALGQEKECLCGEEDSFFDWVWDEDSKSSACLLKQDHREVLFHMDYSCGTAAVRGTTPMKDNQHYWEVKMTSTVYGTDMMVGVGTQSIDLDKYRHAFCSLLGRDEDSWGLSYTGVTHHKAQKELYTSKFGQGDIIGVHLDMWHGTMSFYKNRRPLGIAYKGLQGKNLYPVVSSTAARSGMKVVRCQSFPTSLQFMCCQILRTHIPSHMDVLEVVDLPPGLRTFLHDKVGWLLQSCRLSVKDVVTAGSKRPCQSPYGYYEDDDRRKRRCLWPVNSLPEPS
ncbi:domain-containing SOCS box 3-like [Octopus vulgaris]|uniref:SPRY domain-containing SOCS box protein 3 n=1 Tax=Octopus vulgaris TaxID=6645 RepID=A0AA36AXP4_OCTVU|nr:domain-containing SOCS box 3-like [Octopus vulgaris]